MIDTYSPCPCGSGKKYKFCCLQTQRERDVRESRSSFWSISSSDELADEGAASAVSGDLAAERAFCEKGLRLMAAGEFEKAIAPLRDAVAKAPTIYTAANNLALCLFVTGKLDEALLVQKESLTASPFPNPFGLANLATFLYAAGDEHEAMRYLDEALDVRPPSVDACVKICETLARFRRHQAILDLVDKSRYGGEPAVCYFTGIAAANLGDSARAQRDLRRVNMGHHKADWVRRYLEHLREGTSPHAIRGDWPYLLPYEVCPITVIKAEVACDQAAWLARRIVADVFEAVLNDSPDKTDSGINALKCVTHPDATALLWMIAKGTFGPDSLRMAALQGLQERGEIAPQHQVEVFMGGKRREVTVTGTQLNPEFRYCEALPDKLERLFAKAIEAGCKKKPDWAAIGVIYEEILAAAPGYIPARFNYAVSLLNRRRLAEAEDILRALVSEHPEYLFARAALLQLFNEDGRDKQAKALLKSTAMPTETHPDAMVAWLMAQALYFENRKDFEEARKYIEQAHQIAPDKPRVKDWWKRYQNRTGECKESR